MALQLINATFLSFFLASIAAAVEPEKQPIHSNTIRGTLCGNVVGLVPPAGQRLIIDHVSGYAFLPTSANTTVAVSILITDSQLGLDSAALHIFVATKT